jgi:hypothetical protein
MKNCGDAIGYRPEYVRWNNSVAWTRPLFRCVRILAIVAAYVWLAWTARGYILAISQRIADALSGKL